LGAKTHQFSDIRLLNRIRHAPPPKKVEGFLVKIKIKLIFEFKLEFSLEKQPLAETLQTTLNERLRARQRCSLSNQKWLCNFSQ